MSHQTVPLRDEWDTFGTKQAETEAGRECVPPPLDLVSETDDVETRFPIAPVSARNFSRDTGTWDKTETVGTSSADYFA